MRKLRLERCELYAHDGPPAGAARDPSASPLQGGLWTLVAYGPVDAPTPAAAGEAATLSFDGTAFFGSTGCNRVRGSYTASAEALTVGPAMTTRRACLGEAAARQERAILAALQGELPYAVADGELRIGYDGGRQALVYAAAAEAETSDDDKEAEVDAQ